LWLLLVFVASFLLFMLYMGFVTTGLLRDGLHPWFLGLMIFITVIFYRYLRRSKRFWKLFSWALLARGLDILVMLLLAPIASKMQLFSPMLVASDIVALAAMIAGTAWLVWQAFRFSQFLGNWQN
jgi:hypothetical protein